MTIEQAIQKAIEGGFPEYYGNKNNDFVYDSVFMMPLFWQSLGKAMGWSESPQAHRGLYHKDAYGYHQWIEPQYVAEMHRFIDHLAEGKSAEDYFKTLTH